MALLSHGTEGGVVPAVLQGSDNLNRSQKLMEAVHYALRYISVLMAGWFCIKASRRRLTILARKCLGCRKPQNTVNIRGYISEMLA